MVESGAPQGDGHELETTDEDRQKALAKVHRKLAVSMLGLAAVLALASTSWSSRPVRVLYSVSDASDALRVGFIRMDERPIGGVVSPEETGTVVIEARVRDIRFRLPTLTRSSSSGPIYISHPATFVRRVRVAVLGPRNDEAAWNAFIDKVAAEGDKAIDESIHDAIERSERAERAAWGLDAAKEQAILEAVAADMATRSQLRPFAPIVRGEQGVSVWRTKDTAVWLGLLLGLPAFAAGFFALCALADRQNLKLLASLGKKPGPPL